MMAILCPSSAMVQLLSQSLQVRGSQQQQRQNPWNKVLLSSLLRQFDFKLYKRHHNIETERYKMHHIHACSKEIIWILSSEVQTNTSTLATVGRYHAFCEFDQYFNVLNKSITIIHNLTCSQRICVKSTGDAIGRWT